MSAGMAHITWSSLNVEVFLKRVEETIKQFEIFTKQVPFIKLCIDQYTCNLETLYIISIVPTFPLTRSVTCMSVVSVQTWSK